MSHAEAVCSVSAASAVDQIVRKIAFPYPPLAYQRNTIDAHVEDCLDHAGLYWGMGSGKTYGSTLFNMIYRDRVGAQVIQLVPPILLRQWKKWLDACGISAKIYAGKKKQRSKITLDRDTAYFLMTVETLKQDFDRVYEAFSGRKIMVSIDEATSIKNYDSGNFRAVLQLSAGQAVMPMTGTPLSSPADAYAYIKLVNPGTYRSYEHFENLHVRKRGYFGGVEEWGNLDVMRANLAKRSSFISTQEVHPDLPRALISEIDYDLEKHHSALYKELVDKQLLVFEDGAAIDASTPNKLYHAVQQIVLNYGYFAQHNELVPAGFEVLDEVLSQLAGQKLVVFANYKMSVRAIAEHLQKKGVGFVTLNGDTPDTLRDTNVERFKEDRDCQVFVMNPRAGGVGIDGLQHVCHRILFLEIPTVPMYFWQAVGRLERPGQKYVTDVRIATALGTIQVRLRKNLVQKDALVNEVVPSVNDLRAALYGN
jgi:SNF2 family DNA or RNA helicase